MRKHDLLRNTLAVLLAVFLVVVFTFAFATPARALTGPASRFDWSLGLPAITADNTNTCNNQATARFDWSLGLPGIVYDATATCTAASTGGSEEYTILFN